MHKLKGSPTLATPLSIIFGFMILRFPYFHSKDSEAENVIRMKTRNLHICHVSWYHNSPNLSPTFRSWLLLSLLNVSHNHFPFASIVHLPSIPSESTCVFIVEPKRFIAYLDRYECFPAAHVVGQWLPDS